MFRLAAAPITWGVCELPDWGEVPSPSRVLDEMAAAGFAGTELGSPGFLPTDPAALQRELAARRLALVGAFYPVAFHQPDGAAQSLEEAIRFAGFLAEAGCERLIAADASDERRRAIAGRVTAQDRLPGDAWHRFGETLGHLAERCARLGLQVCFHPHAGTYVETTGELDALLAATPETVGLCLDTGHIAYGGGDPVAVCRKYAARVWHVHAKDVRPDLLARVRGEGIDYSTAVGLGVFAPLGAGMVDFPALLDTLRRAGYDGWYVLEQDVRLGPPWPPQDPLANAQRSIAYLRRLLAATT